MGKIKALHFASNFFMAAFLILTSTAVYFNNCAVAWLAFSSFMMSLVTFFATAMNVGNIVRRIEDLIDYILPALIITFCAVLIFSGTLFQFLAPSGFELCPSTLTIFTNTNITQFERMIIDSQILFSVFAFLLAIPFSAIIAGLLKKIF